VEASTLVGRQVVAAAGKRVTERMAVRKEKERRKKIGGAYKG
jgi:hypothetical protein